MRTAEEQKVKPSLGDDKVEKTRLRSAGERGPRRGESWLRNRWMVQVGKNPKMDKAERNGLKLATSVNLPLGKTKCRLSKFRRACRWILGGVLDVVVFVLL